MSMCVDDLFLIDGYSIILTRNTPAILNLKKMMNED